jgi:hypothetical protein
MRTRPLVIRITALLLVLPALIGWVEPDRMPDPTILLAYTSPCRDHPTCVVPPPPPPPPTTTTQAPPPPTTEAPAAAPTVPSGGTDWGAGVEQWRSLVASFFPADQVDTALRIMACESGGDPGAVNPSSGAAGLMQVMPDWAPKFGVSYEALFDPATNLSIAYALYASEGWASQWSCY